MRHSYGQNPCRVFLGPIGIGDNFTADVLGVIEAASFHVLDEFT